MSSSVLHDQIPHSILFPNQPIYCLPSRVFGCVCFVHILTPGQDKLSAKATKCVVLSYSRLQQGYRYYSPDTHRYFISADVTFFENSSMFPLTHPPSAYVISLPLLYPVPDISSVTPATPPRLLQIYARHQHTDTEPPADSSPMAPSSQRRFFHLPLIFPLSFGKVLVHLVTPILFIISLLITTYLHHILLLFPPCLLFLFLKLCMRPFLIRARNRH